ncbi:MAG: exo-alpha-sialidase [Planctomycetaceae bacterium]|nr:exo-alpha-sialidase [Planctomycetaceae bacterium]
MRHSGTSACCCAVILALALPASSVPAASPEEAEVVPPATLQLDQPLHERCLKIIQDGMAGSEFWPSIHAAEALTVAGHGAEVQKFLKPKLKTETDARQRCGLARELVRAGDRAYAHILLEAISGEDSYPHIHAAESMFKVGEIGDGAALRKAVQQEEVPVLRIMAAAALARQGNLEALAAIRKELNSTDDDVARIAAWALARVGDATDIPRISSRMKPVDAPEARCFFEHALAALGDEAGMQALTENLGSDSPAIRTYASTFAADARAVQLKEQLIGLLDDDNVDVRVRAAQSLIQLSQADSPAAGIFFRDVYPATAENPRISEGSIVQLRDGSLLFATTEFYGGGSDFSKARIVARPSTDGGQTWGARRVLQENTGDKNVMSVTLRYLAAPLKPETPLGLFFLKKNSFSDLDVYLRISSDDGETFGEPILVTDAPGYHVLNNDRVTLLSSGRLLVPVASTPDVHKVNHFISSCYYSDDQGQTWHHGAGGVDQPKRGAMEPEVIELTDGRVMMIVRNQLGTIGMAYSDDGGETFGEPTSLNGIQSPEAPATLRRIPATGDLLLVWNNNYAKGAGHGGLRTPLAAAVSRDDGKTWGPARTLEAREGEQYAYTSLIFADGRALLGYYVARGGKIMSRFQSVPVQWFYQD